MNFLFSVWPYMAFSLLAVGLAVRYLLEQKRMDAVRTEMAEAWSVFGRANVWRSSVALLLVVHATVLLLPQSVLAWNRYPVRLYLFEAIALIAGLAALAGLVKLTWQQVSHGNRSETVIMKIGGWPDSFKGALRAMFSSKLLTARFSSH